MIRPNSTRPAKPRVFPLSSPSRAESLHAVRRWIAGVLLALAILPRPVIAQPEEALLTLELPASSNPSLDLAEIRTWMDWLDSRGFGVNRCGLDPARKTVTLSASGDLDLSPLLDAGFRVLERRTSSPLEGNRRTQSAYFDPSEIQALLMQVAADHPDLTRLFSVGTTSLGRTIWGIEISDQPGVPEDEPAIQFNGQHHSREVATSHVVIDVIDFLTSNYGSNSQVANWVDSYKTVCVPMVNPDGVQHVFDFDSFWRKNRQSIPPSCIGVDLNRNYPYRWGPDRCGFTSSCASSSQTYEGPSAASELETQAMIQLASAYNFVMATSYHSFGRFIDYPYACSNGSPSALMPEHLVIDEMMNGMADAIDAVDSVPRYAVFSPASAGPLSGDDTSWYYAEKGVYSFLVEVGTSFEPAFSEVDGIVNRNRGGWTYLYERLGRARIDVHVTDACTGAPLSAEVTLTDFLFDTGEAPRRTDADFGRWTFLVVQDQSYTVRASEPGYLPAEITVPVGNVPAPVNLVLTPIDGCPPPAQVPLAPWVSAALSISILGFGIETLRRRFS